MLLELIPSDASSPLSVSGRDLGVLAACERGTILLDVSARADATLMTLTGTNGRIALELRGGRLYGEQVLGADGSPAAGPQASDGVERRVLDAEDALGLDDGRPHTIALSVNETGTHLYADGYECFSTTLTAFLAQIGLTGVSIDPDGIAAVTRLAAWAEPLSDRAVMAQSLAATPMVQFAASELSARDARRTGDPAGAQGRLQRGAAGQGSPGAGEVFLGGHGSGSNALRCGQQRAGQGAGPAPHAPTGPGRVVTAGHALGHGPVPGDDANDLTAGDLLKVLDQDVLGPVQDDQPQGSLCVRAAPAWVSFALVVAAQPVNKRLSGQGRAQVQRGQEQHLAGGGRLGSTGQVNEDHVMVGA